MIKADMAINLPAVFFHTSSLLVRRSKLMTNALEVSGPIG